MKILYVTDRLSLRGGADLHLRDVVSRFAVDHVVTVAAARIEAGAGIQGIETVRVPGLDRPAGASERLMEGVAELAGRGADVVHVQNVMCAQALRTLARTGRMVATVQDHRVFCPGRGKWTAAGAACTTQMSEDRCRHCFVDPAYFEHILGATRARLCALLSATSLVVLSRYMLGELVGAGVPADRIHVIPPFLSLPEDPARALPGSTGAPAVVFAGRVVEAKGVLDAVRAVAAVRSVPAPRLVVAGDGPGLPAMRELARASGVGLEGGTWLARAALAATLRRSSVLLMPGLWQEPFGIVGLEALSLGVPVVAYDVGGVREWFNGPPAWLVAHGDREGLTWALEEVLGDPGRARATARECAAALRTAFARDPAYRRLEEVYRTVASYRPAGET